MAGYGGWLGHDEWSCLRGEAALDPAGTKGGGFAMGIASSREEALNSWFVCARRAITERDMAVFITEVLQRSLMRGRKNNA
jgi:hypothetical protein